MNKIEFFNNLHEKLGKKYNVNPSAINFIRERILWGKLKPLEVIKKAKEKLRVKKSPRRLRIYNDVVDLYKKLTEEEFKDILQKTKFDK